MKEARRFGGDCNSFLPFTRVHWSLQPATISLMNHRVFVSLALFSLVFLGVFTPIQAQGLPAQEKAKIEALLAHLGNLSDATFVRNGSGYDAKTAAKFLRKKWEANEDDIKTANDFIAKAASVSSTTGKPYLIRLKDAPEMPCADYLTAQLKKLEVSAPNP